MREWYWTLGGVANDNVLYGPLTNFSRSFTWNSSHLTELIQLGSVTVTLTVTNWLGFTASFSHVITVQGWVTFPVLFYLKSIFRSSNTPNVFAKSATSVTLTRTSLAQILQAEYVIPNCSLSRNVTLTWSGLPAGSSGTVGTVPTTYIIQVKFSVKFSY